MSRSTEASNFVVVISRTKAAASDTGYTLPASSLATAFLRFLVNFATLSIYLIIRGSFSCNGNSHTTRRSGHHLHCRLYRKGIEVGHFVFSNRTHLIPGYGTHPFPVGLC